MGSGKGGAIKQIDRDYATYEMRLEAVLDALFYHPMNRRHYRKLYKKGVYARRIARLLTLMRNKFGSLEGLDLHFTGVSHLDAAWLYPVVDTKVRNYKTFYKAVEHCEEFPFFIFAQTSPQYYQWIKAYDKRLWERVKEMVKKGRIEVTGGMWVEPDLDMPFGESLVRQRLYGQHFYLREFGFYPKLESLLDVFGYPWSVPQILVKSGAEFFWTTKDSSTIPFNAFYWQGIDGSRIFTFQFTYNWDSLTSIKSFKKRGRYPKKECCGRVFSGKNTAKEIENCVSKEKEDYDRNFPLFYGLGDGGRGPLELEIMWAESLRKVYGGVHGSQYEFMQKLRKSVGERYFVWNDEKFLSYHRGTKTTQVGVKHYNRLAEMHAYASESFLTVAFLLKRHFLGQNRADASSYESIYKRRTVFEMWRNILFNQFHDILPGSSIPEVYDLALKEQKTAIAMAKSLYEYAINLLEDNNAGQPPARENSVGYKDAPGSSSKVSGLYYIINPLYFTRSEYVKIGDSWIYIEGVGPFTAVPVKFNRTARNDRDVNDDGDSIDDVFQILSGPLDVKIVTSVSEDTSGKDCIRNSGDGKFFILENSNIRALIDRATGSLYSLLYKSKDLEVIDPNKSAGKKGSGFRVFHDYPKKNKAWNIDYYYPKRKISVKTVREAYIHHNSGGKIGIKAEYSFLNSRLSIFYYLRPRDRALGIQINSDLKDPEVLVKYFFPLKTPAGYAVSDIPYGVIPRAIVKRTKWERIRWEMNMQKWVDFSDEKGGITFFNNNRYGFSATPNGCYITLTRTPKYPGTSILFGATRFIPKKDRPKYTDLKPYSYELALYPHEGSWRDPEVIGEIWRRALSFNLPMGETCLYMNGYIAPEDDSVIKTPVIAVNRPNIQIGALKLPEIPSDMTSPPEISEWRWDGQSFIIRLVELGGVKTDAEISFTPEIGIKRVEEVDLLELNPVESPNGPAEIRENTLILTMGPYEIRTFKVYID